MLPSGRLIRTGTIQSNPVFSRPGHAPKRRRNRSIKNALLLPVLLKNSRPLLKGERIRRRARQLTSEDISAEVSFRTRTSALNSLPLLLHSPTPIAHRFTRITKGLVEVNGIEPMTPCLQSRCSPS